MSGRRAPLAALALVALAGTGVVAAAGVGSADTYQAMRLYAEAMSAIHDGYVDELAWTKMVRDGIRGAVQGLDGDSTVREPSPSADHGHHAILEAGDVGLALARRAGLLTVVAAPAGLPAAGAGIRSGDRILTFDGEAVEAATAETAARRLRGLPGSQVSLTVIRSGWAEAKPFTLTRVDPPPTAPSHRLLDGAILYVRIPRVDDTAARTLGHVLTASPADRATGLVLDLRDTAGGQIEAARAIASLFLDPGCVITHIESRGSGTPPTLTTVSAPSRWNRPVVLLVSRGTASAAEVLAGAMQDTRRAVIVGSPTFGDASTQSTIPLSDGSTLSLTTARYLTPRRHPITGHGIAPDVAPSGGPRGATAGTDPELELASEMVKAASILEHGGVGAAPAEVALGRCDAAA
ncbi:MAG TPA: S41 family peptidase [Candidatus Nitrosotalea sp.]|jgi:carboxyl-terminal processing protease|nr:S41 family peptidase [Candidatus Nitrosotalea sp.]